MLAKERRRPIRGWSRGIVFFLLGALVVGCDSDASESSFFDDPAATRIISEDIGRFWTAYDEALRASSRAAQVAAFQTEYIDPATPGLNDLIRKRIGSAANLRDAVFARQAYFDAIRPQVLGVADGAWDAEVRASFNALDRLYPDAVFADVYFLVGRMTTGGTVSDRGLLIGTELFALGEGTPLEELTPWEQVVVRPDSLIPAIAVHELVHIQQAGGDGTLLAQALREGAADFIGEMTSGAMFNAHLHAFADTLEAELWADFAEEMNGRDFSRWLYNASNPPPGRPADLGYYVGYKVCEHYYENAANREAALAEIIALRDPAALLEASGYAEQFARPT